MISPSASSPKPVSARPSATGPSREEIEKWPYLSKARNTTKAEVRRGQWPSGNGEFVVAKDIRRQPLWFRLVYGRHVLKREWEALLVLEEVAEVPRALHRVDADCIVMEFRAGTPAHELPSGDQLDQLLMNLTDLVGRIHAHGVTHGDLHRDNILRADDGTLTLVDWATSCVYGNHPPLWKSWTFKEFAALDRRAVAKIKARHARHLLSPAETDLLANGGSAPYRLVKKARVAIRRLMGKRTRQGTDYTRLLEKDAPGDQKPTSIYIDVS